MDILYNKDIDVELQVNLNNDSFVNKLLLYEDKILSEKMECEILNFALQIGIMIPDLNQTKYNILLNRGKYFLLLWIYPYTYDTIKNNNLFPNETKNLIKNFNQNHINNMKAFPLYVK